MIKTKGAKRMLCTECGQPVKLDMEPFAYRGIPLGTFEAHVCPRCGEASFTRKGSLAIERVAKRLGLWGTGPTTLLSVSHDPAKKEVLIHYGSAT
jgi:predicted RNA-binding Zn-ribbon protein involved in translation (DUF1610 family)